MMNKFKLLLPVFLLATAATASIDTPTIQNDQYTKVFDTTTHKIPDNIKDIANNISNYVNTNYSIEHLKTIFPEEDFLKFKEELMNSTTDIRREILEALSYDEFIENQHNNLSGFASHISEEADTMLLINDFFKNGGDYDADDQKSESAQQIQDKLENRHIRGKYIKTLHETYKKQTALASHLNDIIKNITENEFIIDKQTITSDGITGIKQDIQLKIASKILESKGITPITATLYLG